MSIQTNILTIAIDFDGTLNQEHMFPEIGEPRLWLINQAIQWKKDGHKLILWTCREDVAENENTQFQPRKYLTEAIAFCKSFGLEFDAVNQNIAEVKYPGLRTSRKINADIYIDDKSCMFNDEYVCLVTKNGVFSV
jgi:hypothetical protein